MQIRRACAFLAITQVLVGCAEFTHLTRERSLPGGTAFFIDAKQRAIFARGGVVCAEPSPDALSAIAASQGLTVGTADGTTVGESLSIAEAAGAIGLRTQSIQLMRDHMYRVCEGYHSGAISGLTFQLLHRRFQTTMVGILAIEQLTGAVRAPTIVLGGSASMGDAEAIESLTASRERVAASVTEAENAVKAAQEADEDARAELAAAESAVAAAPDDEAANQTLAEKKSRAEGAAGDLLTAQGAVAGRKASLAAIDRNLQLARSSGSASASGVIEAQQAAMSSGDITTISTAVAKIVEGTMGLSNTSDFCTVILAESADKQTHLNLGAPVVAACLEKFLSDDFRTPASNP